MANNNIAAHPYDASINEAVEVGFFSKYDDVREVHGQLRSAGALELDDENELMATYGDNDIYEILAMSPKTTSDTLPLGAPQC